MAIGERLKSLRKGVGLTQMGFAKSFQVSNGAVAMWETNKREPDNETLSRLADFFGVSVDYLLGRENEKTPPAAELTEEERELLNNFRALNPTMRKYALEIIKAALSTQEQAAIDSIEQKKKYV